MKMNFVSGSGIAVAAVALAMGGATISSAPATAKAAKTVMCVGINSCKGTSSCKTALSSCKGKNSCKGLGWTTTASEQECTAKGGKVIDAL